MPKLVNWLVLTLFTINPALANKDRPLTFSELAQAAGMAAAHDGYDIVDSELEFEETDGPDGSGYKIPGYVSVRMHYYIHPEAIYTIRTDTGDVINTFTCTLYRYPDLMKFRAKRMKETGSPAVTAAQIDDDLSCMGIKIAPAKNR